MLLLKLQVSSRKRIQIKQQESLLAQKACELCKVIKGTDNTAWKTHNTSECRSKVYDTKRMASASSEEPLHKKSRSGKTYSRTSLAINKVLKKKLRSAQQDVTPAISAVQTLSLTDWYPQLRMAILGMRLNVKTIVVLTKINIMLVMYSQVIHTNL